MNDTDRACAMYEGKQNYAKDHERKDSWSIELFDELG